MKYDSRTAEHEPSELELLAQRFAQLSPAPYGVPIPVGEDGREILQAVLCEIDETMLPRRLSLLTSHTDELTLLISNRRLLAITTAKQIDDPARRMPKDLARQFAAVLHRFIAEAEAITLSPPVKLDGFASADLSVSAALLSEALGLTQRRGAVEETDAPLATVLQGVATAWLEATPNLHFSSEHGPDTELQALKEVWTRYRRTPVKRAAQDNRIQKLSRQCIRLPWGREAWLVFITEDEQKWVLAVVPKARFQSCALRLL